MTPPPLTPDGLHCVELRCAHQVDPLGVAPNRVRLSWRLEGTGTGRAQRAYQVLVTPEEPDASAAWDSGRVESAMTADIAYPGEASGGLGGVVPPRSQQSHPADRGRPVQLEGAGLG